MNECFATNHARWQAVVDRETAASGGFVYAVRTTGIYCRPGCSSRLPLQKNVTFFDSADSAQLAGYRPCRRCKPDQTISQQPPAAVEHACQIIAEHTGVVSLDELASAVGLSASHLHRLFKQTLGVSPRAFAEAKRVARFRDELHAASSVTSAVHASGYSSNSRVYTTATDHLGMPPQQLQRH